MANPVNFGQVFGYRTIAVVGCSQNPAKPSHQVPKYLQEQGFKIIPVNPRADQQILGEQVYDSLAEVPAPVDIVLVFRPSGEVPQIAEQVFARPDVKVLWLQEGISSPQVAAQARKRGLVYLEDLCMYKEHNKQ